MKSIQLAAAGIFSLAFSGISYAQEPPVTIYLVASNGDRNATQEAVARLLTTWTYQGLSSSGGGVVNPAQAGGDSQPRNAVSRGSNAGTWNGIWQGAPGGPRRIILKTNYSGALAGIQAVANTDILKRFDNTTGAGTTPIPVHPDNAVNTADYHESKVDFGLSTNFHHTSPFRGSYQGVTYTNTIEAEEVGISQLGFYGSPGLGDVLPEDKRNLTTAQARLLYTEGAIPLALLTGRWTGADGAGGDSGDSRKYLYALNRNTDAGQRFSALQEIGIKGIDGVLNWKPNPLTLAANTTGVGPGHPDFDATKTFSPGTSGRTVGGLVTSHDYWGTETWSSITSTGGYANGASLATALTHNLAPSAYQHPLVDSGALGGWYIGYVTPGDADQTILGIGGGQNETNRPLNTRGIALRYNGVANTADNVKNGTYTLWLYNRIVRPEGGVVNRPGDPVPGIRSAFVNALAAKIRTVVSVNDGIALSDVNLKVHRQGDGDVVKPGPLPE